MTIAYPRVAQRLFNRALLIERNHLEALLHGVGPRLGLAGYTVGREFKPLAEATLSVMPAPAKQPVAGDQEPSPFQRYDAVAYIEVSGVLVNKGDWLDALCGLTSYELIRMQLDAAAADPSVGAIMLDIDSGGGEAAGCFDLAARIAEVAKEKPVVAALSDVAFSAAYAIASACSTVFIPQLGEAGSIGVVSLHVDSSKAIEMEGLNPTLIFSGAHKVDGHGMAPLPDKVRAERQVLVDGTRRAFAQHVATHRGLSVEQVMATEARCFTAEAAIELGLCDAIATRYEVFEALLADVSGPATAPI